MGVGRAHRGLNGSAVGDGGREAVVLRAAAVGPQQKTLLRMIVGGGGGYRRRLRPTADLRGDGKLLLLLLLNVVKAAGVRDSGQ